MATITTTPMTFEEFERLPDELGDPKKLELLEGELIELPIPEAQHVKIGNSIRDGVRASLLEARTRGEASDLGEAFHEMGYKLPNTSYVRPDVSVTHAGQKESRFFEGSPAIAIEVISRSNTAIMLDKKIRLYFQFGAREVWVVYPETRHVMVYTLGGVHDVQENESLTTPLVPGLKLSVFSIFAV